MVHLRQTPVAIAIAVGALSGVACNPERKQECEKFLAVMKPLEQGSPSAETVDSVNKDVAGLNLQDQPLHIYASNYQTTLTSLASATRLKDDPSAPDGTNDVVKTRLKEARTAQEDVTRYCAQ